MARVKMASNTTTTVSNALGFSEPNAEEPMTAILKYVSTGVFPVDYMTNTTTTVSGGTYQWNLKGALAQPDPEYVPLSVGEELINQLRRLKEANALTLEEMQTIREIVSLDEIEIDLDI